MLTICYITARKDPKSEWFFSALDKQLKDTDKVGIIVVDFYNAERKISIPTQSSSIVFKKFVSPKPCVWQGEHRLTKDNWWAAANSRNTGLCLTPDGWLAYIDDLSVPTEGWMDCVREAMNGNPKTVTVGAFRKVNNLEVEDGTIKSFTDFDRGWDHRIKTANQDVAPCTGGWLYGYSLAHTDTWLGVGGWPEYADGLKFEDCLMGVALSNAGFPLQFDRRMMVYESEELHHGDGAAFISKDKGVSPKDKSHAALNIAMQSKYFQNYYEGGIPALRRDVLSGKPFPTSQIPQHDWYDSQPICEMT